MSVPSEINALVWRLNQELDQTEQVAREARRLVEQRRAIFFENEILILLLAEADFILNSVNYHQQRIRDIISEIDREEIPNEIFQEAAEDLGKLLGRVIEGKMRAIRLKNRMD